MTYSLLVLLLLLNILPTHVFVVCCFEEEQHEVQMLDTATSQDGYHQHQESPPADMKGGKHPQQQQQQSQQQDDVVPITIWVVRHGEGYHNVQGVHIHDAKLTPQGKIQAADSGRKLRHLFTTSTAEHQQHPDMIFSSPLRRALNTAILALPKSYLDDVDTSKEETTRGDSGSGNKNDKRKRKIILLPELQELHDKPCDTGMELEKLASNFSPEEWSSVNASLLQPNWYRKGPEADTEERGRKRAKRFHKRLIEEIYRHHHQQQQTFATDSILEKSVVLFTHGGLMRHWLLNGEHKTIRHASVYKCTMHLPRKLFVEGKFTNLHDDDPASSLNGIIDQVPFPDCGQSFTPAILPDIISG